MTIIIAETVVRCVPGDQMATVEFCVRHQKIWNFGSPITCFPGLSRHLREEFDRRRPIRTLPRRHTRSEMYVSCRFTKSGTCGSSTARCCWAITHIKKQRYQNWTHGVVASHPLSMREALVSIPSVSILKNVARTRTLHAGARCSDMHRSIG